KVHQFYEDSVANGLKVLAPDINSGEYRFVPVDASTIRYGLGAVKGTGESAIAAILAARKDGPFRDLFDFCERVDKRSVNRRVVEALVRAGAFDGVNAGDQSARASLLRSEYHTSELQSRFDLVCRLLLEKKNYATTCGVATTITFTYITQVMTSASFADTVYSVSLIVYSTTTQLFALVYAVDNT